MEFKDRYVLGEGVPFVIPEVCQLFEYEKGKAFLVKLTQPEFVIHSGIIPNYRLVLEKIDTQEGG
mgnify:CR=1 FL=1